MTRNLLRAGAGAAFALALMFTGCSDKGEHAQEKAKGGAAKADHHAGDGHDHAKEDSKHEGWWCNEHGIPEAECSMCSAKVAKECKAKGDWCEKHDRAKSQCFLCDPKLKEKYASVYRAKYGKEPPPTEDEEKAKEAGKDKSKG